jgi:hypothetical protein
MPRLYPPRAQRAQQSPPSVPTEVVHPDAQRRQLINPTGGKRQKHGGRTKGRANLITRSVRESIIEGLSRAGGGGPEGVVNYVRRVALEDSRLGVAMLSLVAPRQAHVEVVRNEQMLVTIEDLNASLIKAGLPTSREIFALDFCGDAVADVAEAEVVYEEDTTNKKL